MSKRNKRSGSMLLKFSNTSVTSARASHARGSIDLSEYNNGAKRRRFFNSSTELFHILGLILMSLCRKVTNVCYLRRRLIAYAFLVVVGGILHDFASSLLRALFLNLSRGHIFNWAFVKYGWAWNVCFLLPFIAISSHTLNLLSEIELDKIEKSIEQYHDRRLRQLLLAQQNNQARPSMIGPGASTVPPPPKIVSLQSISNSTPSKMIEQYQKRIVNSARDCRETPRFSVSWFAQTIGSAVAMLRSKDLYRLIVCSAIYWCSIACFIYIHGMTARPLPKTNGNAVAVANGGSRGATERTDPLASTGMDISGHTFILIFSNLIFLEECNIMTGWEPLGDKLYDLSREYMNLELDSLAGPLGLQLGDPSIGAAAEVNRVLYLAWTRFHQHTSKLRIVFLLCTLLTLLWDFMLVQTAFFYHSLVEKFIAFVFALAAWFIAYRIIFPAIGLEVKKPHMFQPSENPAAK